MSDLPAFNPKDFPAVADATITDATGTAVDSVSTEVDFNDPYVKAMLDNIAQRDANKANIEDPTSLLVPTSPPAPPDAESGDRSAPVVPESDRTPTGDATQDAPASEPGTSPASADATTDTAPAARVDASIPTGADAATDAPPSSIRIGDRDFTAAQVEGLLGLDKWSRNLPDWMRNAFAGIEQGAFVPITRDDFQKFMAWQEAGTPASPAPSTRDEDLEDLPPAVAKRITDLETLVKQQTTRDQQAQQVNSVEYQQAAQAQAQVMLQRQQIIDQVGASFAESYKLSPQELESLFDHTVQLNIVPALVQQDQVLSPTGQLLKEADYKQVMERALQTAASTHPTLAQKFIDAQVEARLAEQDITRQRVEAKKNLNASLASAPSAAVTTPSADPNKPRTQEQLTAEIADFLRRETANGASAG